MSEKFKKLQNLFDFFVMTCTFDSSKDFVAQLVEQQTLNLWVLSSSLSGVTVKKAVFTCLKRLFYVYKDISGSSVLHISAPPKRCDLHSFLLNFT